MADEVEAGGKAKRQRLTPAQKIARWEQAIARERNRERLKTKKQRDHELIILGGTALAEMRDNPEFRSSFVQVLRARVKDERAREAIAEWLSDISMSR